MTVGLSAMTGRTLVQNAFPDMSPDDREWLITGGIVSQQSRSSSPDMDAFSGGDAELRYDREPVDFRYHGRNAADRKQGSRRNFQRKRY